MNREALKVIESIASGVKANTVAMNEAHAITIHQWVCGLAPDDDALDLLRAARRDALELGGVLAVLRGAQSYQHWLKRSFSRLAHFALTDAAGTDDWWWDEALDRADALVMLEVGALRAVPCAGWRVPEPAPHGFDYTDLMRGLLRASGRGMGERRGEHRASGGRYVAGRGGGTQPDETP